MTVSQFLSEAQDYYRDKYSQTQKKYVAQYLKNMSEKVIGMIFSEILKDYSSSYKAVPAIAEIQKAWHKVKTERYAELQAPPENLLEERTITKEEAQQNIRKIWDILASLGKSKRMEESA